MSQETDKSNENDVSINLEALMESVRGKIPLLQRIVGVFFDEYTGLLADVKRSIDENDAKSLEKAAHRLNGTLIAMTASAASELARKLERMGRAGDLADAIPTFNQLSARIDRLTVDLRALLA